MIFLIIVFAIFLIIALCCLNYTGFCYCSTSFIFACFCFFITAFIIFVILLCAPSTLMVYQLVNSVMDVRCEKEFHGTIVDMKATTLQVYVTEEDSNFPIKCDYSYEGQHSCRLYRRGQILKVYRDCTQCGSIREYNGKFNLSPTRAVDSCLFIAWALIIFGYIITILVGIPVAILFLFLLFCILSILVIVPTMLLFFPFPLTIIGIVYFLKDKNIIL